MTTVGEDFLVEQARCRELLVEYERIGPPGAFAALMLHQVLARADQAAISGDAVAILRYYGEMRECQ